uniref:hypothetical protein n=1 Tax=Lachnoclostridium phocaeense TaxID=1871021 RepID=UPI0026DCAD6C|nr:hypothetical protein [Lachnoclostridium phocaeense]
MKKYLQSDDEIRDLKNMEELHEYLDFRKENDEWVEVFLNELAAVGVPDMPLFYGQYCSKVTVPKNGYHVHIGNIDHEKQENAECISGTGLFLVFPYKDKLTAYPTRWTAYNSICKRAGDDGDVMMRTEARANKCVLPVNEKAERLCRDFQLYSDNCKILLRDGKVSAVLSKDYAILPADGLIQVLENQLASDHPDFAFDKGKVSHEYLLAEYLLNDPEMEESFRLRLNDAGADIASIKAGVQFSTSDVGLSRVNASLFYDADGVRTFLGGGIGIIHLGDASVADFAESCKSLGLVFKECEDRIEELGNMDIADVAGTVRKVQEKYPFLPKTVADAVAADLEVSCPNGGTGVDVYIALNDIVQRHADQSSLSPTRYLNLCEQVAKLMKLPFDRIDQGEEWIRI